MQPTIADRRQRPARAVSGRPYIGPKAQAAVPEDIWLAVEAEAIARECPMSDIWRELITEHGFPSWARAVRGEE